MEVETHFHMDDISIDVTSIDPTSNTASATDQITDTFGTNPESRQYPGPSLPDTGRWIRLLHLQGGSDNCGKDETAISGELRLANLNSAPKYVALSYVWGEYNTTTVRSIKIRGFSLVITENCYQALWHIRKRFGSITIWVDAICINQMDENERTHQVRQMGQIYSQAKCGYVWLSGAGPFARLTMEGIKLRAKMAVPLPLRVILASTPEERQHETTQYRIQRSPMYPLYLKRAITGAKFGFWSLLHGKSHSNLRHDFNSLCSEWLERSWTLQELLLSRDVLFLAGEEALSWQDFLDGYPFKDKVSGWASLVKIWLCLPRHSLQERYSHFSEDNHDLCFRTRITFEQVAVWGVHQYLDFISLVIVDIVFCCAMLISSSRTDLAILIWTIGIPVVSFVFVRVLVEVYHMANGSGHYSGATNALMGKSINGPVEAHMVDLIRECLLHRRCSKPHDRCFSLMGVLGQCGAPFLSPNYADEVHEVFKAFFVSLLQWNRHAILLLEDATLSAPGLMPSWVPDWSYILKDAGTIDLAKVRERPGIYPQRWIFHHIHIPFGMDAFPPEVIDNKVLRLRAKKIAHVDFCANVNTLCNGTLDEDQYRTMLGTFCSWVLHHDDAGTDWFYHNYFENESRNVRRLLTIIRRYLLDRNIRRHWHYESYTDDLCSYLKKTGRQDASRQALTDVFRGKKTIFTTDSGRPGASSTTLLRDDAFFLIPPLERYIVLRKLPNSHGYVVVGSTEEKQWTAFDLRTGGRFETIDIY